MRTKVCRWSGLALLLAGLGVAGCSSDSSSADDPTGMGDASVGDAAGGKGGSDGSSKGGSGGAGGLVWPGSSGEGGGGNGGGSGSAGGVTDAGVDVDFSYDAAPTFDGFNPDTTCAETIVQAEIAPLDLYIMTDKSGSMQGTRWSDVVSAIKAFVDDPASQGMGVGIQYFPVLAGYTTCSNASQCGDYGPCPDGFCRACDVKHYSNPAVGITTLPGGASAIKASLDATSPWGGTPTGPALKGAIQYATSWANSHPGHTVAVVLATDGEPYTCTPESIPDISALAAGGKNQNPPILTFVIGVGTSLTNMHTIAAAGGTGQAYIVNTQGNVGQQFIQALNDIREKALGCEYQMPKTDAGVIDPKMVEMTYTPGSGTSRVIPRMTQGQCAGEGWYYDNDANPTRLVLCPDLCGTVQADPFGKIEISLGCLGS